MLLLLVPNAASRTWQQPDGTAPGGEPPLVTQAFSGPEAGAQEDGTMANSKWHRAWCLFPLLKSVRQDGGASSLTTPRPAAAQHVQEAEF